ncbi:tail fiber assembly protein [Xenorhabdus sp. XENO-7]|uniref:Tail fiber assembly protein n=1 Tax=Xenorhabdus aichiensis TaxID=3025874 RepID=A0ABT5M128_9GAMM|nr:tail fiber assembly protein [Xenorhabdus aichiensis]MDC9621380.1 tail fiber assembly protein [Xenorhabdus aichiensis]
MYFYSAKKNAFFPKVLMQDYINAGSWPDDGIDVSDDVYSEFVGNIPPKGKIRIAGKDGLPAWEDIPPLTQEELYRQAEVKRKQLMIYAKDIIAPLQDAVDLGINTSIEESALSEWRKYRVRLNRIDCSIAPNIEWPKQPKIK